MIGPQTGPMNIAPMKTLTAFPRPTMSHKSAITPPLFVSGALAKTPDKNRVTTSVCTLVARACPRQNREQDSMVPMNMGRRPRSSDPGAHSNGPNTYPNRNTVVTRLADSMETPSSSEIAWIPEVGRVDAKVLQQTLLERLGVTSGKTTYTVNVRTVMTAVNPIL